MSTKAKIASRQTVKAARPIPASIPMPDSPLRHKSWFQAVVRLPRSFLEWVGVAGTAHAFGLLDRVPWFGPVDDARAIIILGFVGALFAIRTVEKTTGVA